MQLKLRPDRLPRSRRKALQSGITLLESLVSIVILAIAVLGMLGMQLRTLAETQTGVRRAQAVRLIEDFAERIKSNPEGFAQLSSYVGGFGAKPTAGTPCDTAVCAPAELARWDTVRWRLAVEETLPMGQAAVFASTDETTTSSRRQLGVVVGWRANERRREGETEADALAYKAPFRLDTGAANVGCPDDLICHLVYVQP